MSYCCAQIASHAGNVCGWTGKSPCTEKDVTILTASRRDLTISFTLDTPTTDSSSEATSTLTEYFKTEEFIEDISDENITVTSSQVLSTSVTFIAVATEPTSNTSQALSTLGDTVCEYVTQNLTASVAQGGAFCVGAECTTLLSGQGFSSNGLWCAGCSIENAGFSSSLEAQVYVYPWSSKTVSSGTLYGGLIAAPGGQDFSLPNGGFVCPVDGGACVALESEIGIVPVTGVVFATFSSDASNPYSSQDLSSIFCPAGACLTSAVQIAHACCCCGYCLMLL